MRNEEAGVVLRENSWGIHSLGGRIRIPLPSLLPFLLPIQGRRFKVDIPRCGGSGGESLSE